MVYELRCSLTITRKSLRNGLVVTFLDLYSIRNIDFDPVPASGGRAARLVVGCGWMF